MHWNDQYNKIITGEGWGEWGGGLKLGDGDTWAQNNITENLEQKKWRYLGAKQHN